MRAKFSMACQLLDINDQEDRQRLRTMAADPIAYRKSLRLIFLGLSFGSLADFGDLLHGAGAYRRL